MALIMKEGVLDPDEGYRAHVTMHLGNLPQTMIILARLVSMDSISEVFAPIIDKEHILALYFVDVIFVIGIMLMSLVAAVIFSVTLEQS